MKYLKILFVGLLLATLFITGCAKCDGEQPRARVVNNGTERVNIQIQTSEGNTVNINNVEPNTTSDWKNYAAGEIKFTISVDDNGGVHSDQILNVTMQDCWEYDIIIDSNNNVSSEPSDRNE